MNFIYLNKFHQSCSKAAGRNNTKCWKLAVKEMLRPNSALLPHLLSCMKHRKLKESLKTSV